MNNYFAFFNFINDNQPAIRYWCSESLISIFCHKPLLDNGEFFITVILGLSLSVILISTKFHDICIGLLFHRMLDDDADM